MTWYRLYNFLLDGKDADIIKLYYKKELKEGVGIFCLVTKSFLVIIQKRHSCCDLRRSLTI